MFTVREVSVGRVKVIWWFVGVVGEDRGARDGKGEEAFEPEWFGIDEVVGKAAFESDRKVLTEGLKVYRKTLGLGPR